MGKDWFGRFRVTTLFAPVLALGCLLWSYWPVLEQLEEHWSLDPQYSHGYLVPIIAAVILWRRKSRSENMTAGSAARYLGLALIITGSLLQVLGSFIYFFWLEAAALLPCLLGLSLLLGGKQAVSWVWPAVLYLLFMIPLPHKLGSFLGQHLQRIATLVSTYVLETLGYPAIAEGNIITVNQSTIGIVEACSGLSMLMILLALATAMAMLMADGGSKRVVLLASAFPIAIVVNVGRITMTGIAQESVHSKLLDNIHDTLGWIMMPLALLLLWTEMRLMNRFVQKHALGASSLDAASST